MIYKCNLCVIPCYLSMDGLPAALCPNRNMHATHAEWVQTEGMFLSEVPA